MTPETLLEELGRRGRWVVDHADWDDIIGNSVLVGDLRFRRPDVADSLAIESVSHAQTIYNETPHSGVLYCWDIELVSSAVEILRRHMLLDDLAAIK